MIIYCDGGSRGNPGPAACAFVATVNEKEIYSQGKYLGIETNNVAEYMAVSIALDWIILNPTKEEIIFNLDSQLIERQINGTYRVRDMKLIKLHDNIKMKIGMIKSKLEFRWNYRTNNEKADALVNKTLDDASTGK